MKTLVKSLTLLCLTHATLLGYPVDWHTTSAMRETVSQFTVYHSPFTTVTPVTCIAASNAVAGVTFAYDTMNRVTNAVTRVTVPGVLGTSPAFTNRWTRDLGGLVTNLTYAAGKSVAYTHDADGLLTSVKDWQGNTWTFTRDAMGKVTQITPPGAPSTSSAFTYDPAGRLTSWNVGTIAGHTITYDDAGKRIRDDITHGAMPKPTLQRTALNTFDAADRLTSSLVRYGQGTNSTPHITETFRYNGNGALTNWVSPPQFPSGGGVPAGWGGSSLSLSYDALGQVANIVAATSPSPSQCEYKYDALGNRILVTQPLATSHLFIPNHADQLKRPLMEIDAATGAILRYYIWGGSRLLGYIDASGTLTVAHSDDFGNVIALTHPLRGGSA